MATTEQRLRGRVVQDLQDALRRLQDERYVVRCDGLGVGTGESARPWRLTRWERSSVVFCLASRGTAGSRACVVG